MDFTPPQKRKAEESIVPMINVVFLLLIFFLMTSQITPPEPFEVALPVAETLGEAESELTLHLSKDGDVQFEAFTGETAWMRLGGRIEPKTVVKLRVDAALPAPNLAQVMQRLSPLGAGSVEIVAVPK